MLVGSNVQVRDTLIPDALRESLIECISWMPLHFVNRWKEFKSHELDMHWYYPLAFSDMASAGDVESMLVELDDSLQPVFEAWCAIKASHAHPVRLYECMLSANAFGTEGRLHRDAPESGDRGRHRTALVYCNRDWQPEWAGETVVFGDDMEISAAVMPKPGRVMIIDGDPVHVGRSVSRICPTDRRALVFKYWAL